MRFLSSLVFGFVLFAGAPSLWGHPNSDSDSSSQLWGHWKFIGYIYSGQFQNSPNPNLVLTFDFFEDGTDILKWYRTNETGFCERKGKYSYDGKKLTDQITWVNPRNSFECWKDPDMVVGKTQVTPLRREGEVLYLDLTLSDDVLIYVWKKEPSDPGKKKQATTP